MFLKFTTSGSLKYIETLLNKLDLEVEIKQDVKNVCYYPSVKNHGKIVAEAVSCWLQLKVKEAGFSIESVRTSELVSSSWGHSQDEMLFISDSVLEEPANVADAENRIRLAIEQDNKDKEESEKRMAEYIKREEERKQEEERRRQRELDRQRELYQYALAKVKYRRTEKLNINENWYVTNLSSFIASGEGRVIFLPESKGYYFEKFTNGKYILCQDKNDKDLFFIKVTNEIYIFGKVSGGRYSKNTYVISKEKIITDSWYSGHKFKDNIDEFGIKSLLERCQSIKEYDTLGLVMNAGSYDGIFSGIFWGVRLNLHGELEEQWSQLPYKNR